MGLAIDVPDVIPQQRIGLEAEAYRAPLVDGHLHRQLLERGARRRRKGLLRQRPPDPLASRVL
jgi:hypothetical protein